jgi:hypothetical protein
MYQEGHQFIPAAAGIKLTEASQETAQITHNIVRKSKGLLNYTQILQIMQ